MRPQLEFLELDCYSRVLRIANIRLFRTPGGGAGTSGARLLHAQPPSQVPLVGEQREPAAGLRHAHPATVELPEHPLALPFGIHPGLPPGPRRSDRSKVRSFARGTNMRAEHQQEAQK